MSTGKSKKSLNTIAKKRLALRAQLWPDLDHERELWNRKVHDGYTTIPRTMPLICRILDSLTPGKPVSKLYLDLWCASWDEALITIASEKERAFSSGFTGQRALYTWRERMKTLNALGFIRSKAGPKGEYHHNLLVNPYFALDELRTHKDYTIQDVDWNALCERKLEIGA